MTFNRWLRWTEVTFQAEMPNIFSDMNICCFTSSYMRCLYLFGKANSEILIMDCEDGHFPLNIKVICCSSNHLGDKISKYIEKTQFPKAQGDIFVSSFVVKKQKILTFQKLEQEKDELFITVIDDSFSAI